MVMEFRAKDSCFPEKEMNRGIQAGNRSAYMKRAEGNSDLRDRRPKGARLIISEQKSGKVEDEDVRRYHSSFRTRQDIASSRKEMRENERNLSVKRNKDQPIINERIADKRMISKWGSKADDVLNAKKELKTMKEEMERLKKQVAGSVKIEDLVECMRKIKLDLHGEVNETAKIEMQSEMAREIARQTEQNKEMIGLEIASMRESMGQYIKDTIVQERTESFEVFDAKLKSVLMRALKEKQDNFEENMKTTMKEEIKSTLIEVITDVLKERKNEEESNQEKEAGQENEEPQAKSLQSSDEVANNNNNNDKQAAMLEGRDEAPQQRMATKNALEKQIAEAQLKELEMAEENLVDKSREVGEKDLKSVQSVDCVYSVFLEPNINRVTTMYGHYAVFFNEECGRSFSMYKYDGKKYAQVCTLEIPDGINYASNIIITDDFLFLDSNALAFQYSIPTMELVSVRAIIGYCLMTCSGDFNVKVYVKTSRMPNESFLFIENGEVGERVYGDFTMEMTVRLIEDKIVVVNKSQLLILSMIG